MPPLESLKVFFTHFAFLLFFFFNSFRFCSKSKCAIERARSNDKLFAVFLFKYKSLPFDEAAINSFFVRSSSHSIVLKCLPLRIAGYR